MAAEHRIIRHPGHKAPHSIASWHIDLVAIPSDIFINRPSTPGMREEIKTFATGTRLDLCHNVPNQPGGGGVIMPLGAGMTFHQVHGSASVPVYKQAHPHDQGPQHGCSHWIKGYVQVGTDEEVLEGWVLLSVDHTTPQMTKLP